MDDDAALGERLRRAASGRHAPPSCGSASGRTEFLAVYGAELAPLVTPAGLSDSGRTYRVGRHRGRPATVAMVGRTTASLIWLHSTEASRPTYERLGFRVVDTHLQLV